MMDSETFIIITWQAYHGIIVALLLVCFVFIKFYTMLKNVVKEEYLKLKINVLLPLNKIQVLLSIVFCLFFQDMVNGDYFGYILSNAASLLQGLLCVSLLLSSSLFLCGIIMVSYETLKILTAGSKHIFFKFITVVSSCICGAYGCSVVTPICSPELLKKGQQSTDQKVGGNCT